MDLRRQILNLVRGFAADATRPRLFVPGKTYIPVTGKVIDADDAVALTDASLDLWLTAGRYAEIFERRVAERTGAREARATVSGSAANLLAFAALTSWKLKERRVTLGSEVVTVAAGFPTTVAPIVQNGCVPVFCDVTLPNGDINCEDLAQAVTPKTRAIMMAHTLGNPFNLDAVMALAREHNLFVIEDCCDAFGATFRGQPVGSFGDLGTLSFYPAHHITTGEGGAVFASNKMLMTIVTSLRDWGRDCWCAPGFDNTCNNRFNWQLGELPHGYDHKYIYSHLGYNLKITDMQAAIGASQLDKLDHFIARRRENWNALKQAFLAERLDTYFQLPEAAPHSEPSWFGFLLTVRDDAPFTRPELIRHLESRGIGTRLLFAGNLVRQPAFKDIPHRVVSTLAQTDRMMQQSFWIGVWPGIKRPHIDYMVETIGDFVRGRAR